MVGLGVDSGPLANIIAMAASRACSLVLLTINTPCSFVLVYLPVAILTWH